MNWMEKKVWFQVRKILLCLSSTLDHVYVFSAIQVPQRPDTSRTCGNISGLRHSDVLRSVSTKKVCAQDDKLDYFFQD